MAFLSHAVPATHRSNKKTRKVPFPLVPRNSRTERGGFLDQPGSDTHRIAKKAHRARDPSQRVESPRPHQRDAVPQTELRPSRLARLNLDGDHRANIPPGESQLVGVIKDLPKRSPELARFIRRRQALHLSHVCHAADRPAQVEFRIARPGLHRGDAGACGDVLRKQSQRPSMGTQAAVDPVGIRVRRMPRRGRDVLVLWFVGDPDPWPRARRACRRPLTKRGTAQEGQGCGAEALEHPLAALEVKDLESAVDVAWRIPSSRVETA